MDNFLDEALKTENFELLNFDSIELVYIQTINIGCKKLIREKIR